MNPARVPSSWCETPGSDHQDLHFLWVTFDRPTNGLAEFPASGSSRQRMLDGMRSQSPGDPLSTTVAGKHFIAEIMAQ
jgi:hypothetical protein